MGTVRRNTVALVVTLALVGAACGGGDDDKTATGEKPTGGTFSTYIGEPEHLVPGNTNESEGAQVLSALFTGLVEYDAKTSQPANAIAESIESTDSKTWTIRIKDGWKFHNDEEVTAQSFVDAWNFTAYAPNANGNSAFFENVVGYDEVQGNPTATPPVPPSAKEMSGLKALDERTIQVTLKEPFSQYPLTLGYTAFYPMPKAAFEDLKAYEQRPIGNGPFMMAGPWEHDVKIGVVKFDDYKGPKPNADSIEFRIYSQIATAFRDLQAGNLDIMDSVPPEELANVKAAFGERFIERPSSSFTYLGFPLYQKAFQKKELRQAISLAIDRQAIVDTIFNGTRQVARSVVSPVVAGSRIDACGFCAYDPVRAKQLFTAAGGFRGTLTLWFNSGAGHEEWMEAVANQLRTNLGIRRVKFETKEFAEYLGTLDEKKVTGPFRLGWVMDYPSPQNYLQPIYSTTGSSNNAGYSNAQVDALIAEGNRAATIAAGIASYHKAENIILDELPVAPMWFGKIQAVRGDRVSNVAIDAFGHIRVSDVKVLNE